MGGGVNYTNSLVGTLCYQACRARISMASRTDIVKELEQSDVTRESWIR